MKSFITLIGIILVIYGIAILAYNGFTYNSRMQNALIRLSNVPVTTETQTMIMLTPLSPIVGGTSLVVGTIILALSQRGKGPKKR